MAGQFFLSVRTSQQPSSEVCEDGILGLKAAGDRITRFVLTVGTVTTIVLGSGLGAIAMPRPTYTQWMNIGYAATEQRDYQTALINFRRALAMRPGDPYATAAISNVWTYIQHEKTRATWFPRLEQAMAAQDWRCSVEIIDRLIPTYPKNSMQRTELITKKGELLGLMDAGGQRNIQSTLCTDA